MPDESVISVGYDPPYSSERNEIAPLGVIPTGALKVLRFLYDDQVTCWVSGSDGVWIAISVQSTMHLVVE